MYINQQNGKDCMQTTISNLLGIDYNSIPRFYESYEKNKSDFFLELDNWLNSIGYYRIMFDVKLKEDGKIYIPFYCGLSKLICIGILQKKHRKYSHAVLLELKRNEHAFAIEIIHDPKINTEYDLNDIVQIEIITKL